MLKVELLDMCPLKHFRPMLKSYRNQLIDLYCKSIDWFLYDDNIGLKRVEKASSEFLHVIDNI